MSLRRPIFVAATRQHTGKTTCSLALLSGLKKRFDRVGFIKPVGQQHIPVMSRGVELRVDKDVQLMREYFELNHIEYGDMSPVLVPKSYTKQYIDGKISVDVNTNKILDSYKQVASSSDAVLLEGTGHTGVGSIIELSNAKVASLLGADMVLVANGGLGSAFDELELNRMMCDYHGVRVKGVILNKVRPDKVEMVKDYFERLIGARWGIPLLGVVPDLEFLGTASLGDVETVLGAELLAGHNCRGMHFSLEKVEIVTTGLRRFLRKSLHRKKTRTRELYVTHCTRDDIILGYLTQFQTMKMEGRLNMETSNDQKYVPGGTTDWAGALVLCMGKTDGVIEDDNAPLEYVMDIVKRFDAPVMLSPARTDLVKKVLDQHTAKLGIRDPARVGAAIMHYEPHIDFGKLLD